MMKHSIYFDGKVQSLELNDGTGRATVGVIQPGTYTFSTSTEEIMTITAGTVKVKLPGEDWKTVDAGGKFKVGSGSSFEISAEKDAAYICYYR